MAEKNDNYVKDDSAHMAVTMPVLDAPITGENDSVANPSECEVFITRVFDAPRELVFKAWTSPEHLIRWYAPNGCTVHFREMDFRQGGAFHGCIRNPAIHDCWFKGLYNEIVAPELIVYTMVASDANGDSVKPSDVGMDPDWPSETIVTVTFAESEGKTTLTLRQTVLESIARRTGAYPSWLEMLDHLAKEIEKARSSTEV